MLIVIEGIDQSSRFMINDGILWIGVDIHGSLSEEEPASMINICQANINADACTDHATTQVTKSYYPSN